jgi:Mrp family chromosome partitioning ATPase
LALNRLRRAIARQWLTVVFVAGAVTGFGALYEAAGGVRWLTAVATWLGAGAALGLVAGAIRELSRNTVTSISSLGKHRGYTVFGASPELSTSALRQLPPDQRSALGCLAYQPASPYATAFRDLQGALANDKLVAFIGAVAGEGATTCALSTAVSATQQGRSVILLDCDIRRRSLTHGFGMDPDLGVLEACERPEYWRDYVEHEQETGLHFLPAAPPSSPWRSLVGEAGFPVLLKELQRAYDLVVLDCPPALASAEGAALARMANKCVVVAVWDRTPIGAVRMMMRNLRTRARLLTGIYVNRVPRGYRFGRLRPD